MEILFFLLWGVFKMTSLLGRGVYIDGAYTLFFNELTMEIKKLVPCGALHLPSL